MNTVQIGVDGGDDRSELKVITMFLFRTREKDSGRDPDNPEARWWKSEVACAAYT